MSNRLKNTVNKLVRELGYYETKKMMGISFTELAEIVDEPIHSELANEILIENIVKKTIQTKYKEFNISKSFDNVVYWEARIKTGRFLPYITEHIEVVATPFWNGNESTPVELDWYGLIDDNSNTNMDIVSINGGDLSTSTYVRIDDKKIFKNTHSLFKWYEEFYLPTIYEIIRTNYIPNAQQRVEDMLDEKFFPSNITEDKKRNQGHIKFDKNQLKIFNLFLNKKLKEIIKDFKKIDIEEVVYNEDSNYFAFQGKIYFDEDWIYSQFRKYNYSKPLPPYDELSFGDIISSEDHWYKDLNETFRMVFSSIMSTLQPKYTSYSWLTVHPIEEETTNLQEQIKKVLKESLESKWNKGNYNYQHGFCHYFAYNIIDKIRNKFPNKKVNYYLLLAQEMDEEDGTIVNDYLVHAYIKIDNFLLDSNGISNMNDAWRRLEEWKQRQINLVPDTYKIEIFDEESVEIPEYFFNNEFCNTKKVKEDLKDFLNNPIVKRILRDK